MNLEDVAALAAALPGVTEGTSYGNRAWRVGKKLFVWERPLRSADLDALGDDAPDGPIVGLRVDDLAEKAAVLQGGHAGLFTTPHFDAHPTLLVHLDEVDPALFEELVTDAWLCQAPKRAVTAFLEERATDDPS